MNKLVKCLIVAIALSPSLVSAQPAFVNIQEEIRELHQSTSLKREELRQELAATEGYYLIESNTATYIFSNPRIYDRYILLDVEVTNDTKGLLDLASEAWTLSYSQEYDDAIEALWLADIGQTEIDGRRLMNSNLKIKSGATVSMVVALSNFIDYGAYAQEDLAESESDILEEADGLTDNLPTPRQSPIYIQIDAYNNPRGQTEMIIVDF